jgi:phage terminase large subunit-like protein
MTSRNTVSIDPVTAYARRVVDGSVVAGPYVRAACARHLADLESQSKKGLKFCRETARRVLAFFPKVLRLNGGQFEGQPFVLHESQEFIIGSLFGWLREDGTRRFRFAYIEQGKSNGKTPLLAGIGLYCMVADNEPRAEIYAAATKKDQAMVLFRDAVAMREQSPALKRRLKPSGKDDKVWNLFDPETNSFFRPIAADDGQSGPRPHVGLIDELHEHKTATVVNMMAAGRKWRRQPFTICITNSGTNRTSVCYEYREKAIRVCQRMDDDDTMFGYVCALDDGEDPMQDESCWIKANPLLDSVVTRQYLREEVNQARGMPSKESYVRRLNFCEWTEAHNPAVSYEDWKAAESDYTLEAFRGKKVIAAFDLSATTDLTSCVFLQQDGGENLSWPMFWIPEEGLADRAHKDKVPYDDWVRKGFVFTTPGKAINKDFVVKHVAEILGKYDIEIVKAPYDRYKIDTINSACGREGVTWPLEPFGQGYVSMGQAVDSFETSLVEGTFRHPGNPCFTWCAANAVYETNPAGDRKPDKSKATGRIDGFVALIMCFGVIEKAEPQPEYQILFIGK